MYDLFNDKSEFSFNFLAWGDIIELALHYGWSPMGTLPSDLTMNVSWEGGYQSNDFQYVLPADAQNLAKALEGAIKDIPEIKLSMPFRSEVIIDGDSFIDLDELISSYEDTPVSHRVELLLLEFSGQEGKNHIEKFIAFCNEGKGFIIS